LCCVVLCCPHGGLYSPLEKTDDSLSGGGRVTAYSRQRGGVDANGRSRSVAVGVFAALPLKDK